MQIQRLDDVRRHEIDSLNCREEKIKEMDFGYSPLEKPLLNKFSLNIEQGH